MTVFQPPPPKQTTTHFTNLIPVFFLEKCPLWITGPGTSLIQIMAHLGSSSTSASFTRALHLGRMGIPATEDPQWFQIFFWSVETTNKNLLWPMWLEESDPIRSIENNFPWSLWFFPSCHGFLKPWLLVFCFRGHVNSEVLFLDLSTKGSEAVRKQLETSSKLEVVKAFEDDVHWCEILGQEPECEDIWRYSCYLVKTFFVQSGFFCQESDGAMLFVWT